MILAQKKMATLDEDLARFNAPLRNGNGSRPSSTVVEGASGVMKTKTMTLNSNPIPASTSTPQNSSVASQTLPIKPVLKHAKSCEVFLESHSSVAGVGHPPLPPPRHMGPVMRFPSSTRRGDMNSFDELGSLGDGRPHGSRLRPTSAHLRPTKSAEWRMPGSWAILICVQPLCLGRLLYITFQSHPRRFHLHLHGHPHRRSITLGTRHPQLLHLLKLSYCLSVPLVVLALGRGTDVFRDFVCQSCLDGVVEA
ncbi:hypothetical protein BYT27DRAFT_6900401 [Phlegmacium glaucopus]|nr:hypothetical protein BYT27DRAFT_6900401 [Phlegmacium glaucopus]